MSMPVYAFFIIVVGLTVWFYPFVKAHNRTAPASVIDRRSRWGILLQFVAFTLLWQGHFWDRRLPAWHVAVSVVCFLFAAILSWSSSRALTGQLRIDAALGAEHKLIQSGPYALVRNPIYTSMLLVLCAMGIIVSGWKLFVPALVLFVAGTEIRVRTEERLLSAHFGEEFQNYKRRVPAYLPFLG